MREIKFRAWDKVNKRMGHFEPGFSWHDEYELWYINQITEEHDKQITDVPCGDNIVIMQFTGLKDKNGKDIYEGDIVSYNNRLHEVMINFNGYYLQRYKLWNGKFKPAFQYAMSLFTKPSKERFGGEVDSAEVVGNIYENPDLVESLNQIEK